MPGPDMTTREGRAGLRARLAAADVGNADGLGADPLPAAQRAKLDALGRWAVIVSAERLPDGRLRVTFDYLGLTQTVTYAADGVIA